MPALKFDNPNPAIFSPSFKMGSYAAPPIAASYVIPASVELEENTAEQASLDQSSVDWSNLSKGLRWAFGIEGGAALLIYGMWELWHLWR